MKAFTSSLILVCSCAFVLILAACVQSGAVTQFTLQETQIVGGQATQGQVTVQVTPANFNCQNLACPVLVESSNPAVAAVQGGLDFGASNARVVFADGANAIFTVTTKPVTSATDVTFTTSFLVCIQKQGGVNLNNCQRVGARMQATLQVAPETREGLFTCEDKFAIGEPGKPPLSLDDLTPPSDFTELPRNPNYVIGFHFLKTDAALLAQPVQARCQFTNPEFGSPLGVVWKIDEERQSTAYMVALRPDTANAERAQGFLFDDQRAISPIDFTVTPLKPTEAAASALPIDVTIRANEVCFRVDDRRYCSSGSDQHELSVKDQFPTLYQELVQAQLARAAEALKTRDLLRTGEVALDNSISEIEDAERVKSCSLQESESCHADLIAAPTLAQPEQPPNSEVEVGVLNVTADIQLDGNDNTLRTLPSGYYVVYAKSDEQGQWALPVAVRGVHVVNGDITSERIEGEVPAQILPYINPERRVWVAEIFNFGLGEWFCLLKENCGFTSRR